MSQRSEDFFAHFKDLYEEYVLVKKSVILAENLDPENKIYIAPLNQLRSALDHAFKATVVPADQVQHELNEFREHVRRAGYDSFEIVISNRSLQIINSLKNYPTETLNAVFPEYYKTIRPTIEDIRNEVAEIRSDKDHHKKPFNEYMIKINTLNGMYKQVFNVLPGLDEYEAKRKKKQWRSNFVQYSSKIIPVVIAFGLGLLANIFMGRDSKDNTSRTQETKKIQSPDPIRIDSTVTKLKQER